MEVLEFFIGWSEDLTGRGRHNSQEIKIQIQKKEENRFNDERKRWKRNSSLTHTL
jgi:hypothetical protein